MIDSSGWLEFFSGGPLAAVYEPFLNDPTQIVTPVAVIYEVYRQMQRTRGIVDARAAIEAMTATTVVPLTLALTLTAAELGLQHRLAASDSQIYATAVATNSELVTSDADFADLPGVRYIPKPRTQLQP